MNKESIYKIIGYRGEYSNSVKKALRKLLKENHPDHNGDKELFKLITDVKKELETNQVSFKYEKRDNSIKYDDIDIEYCSVMIAQLEEEQKALINVLEEDNKKLKMINDKYKELYRQSVNDTITILEKENSIKKLNNIKKVSMILLIPLITIFIIAIIKNSIIIFIGFGIMCLITIMLTEKYFLYFHEVTKNSEKKIHKYIKTIDSIKNISEEHQNKEKDLLNTKRKLKKIENDLRFYSNLLK